MLHRGKTWTPNISDLQCLPLNDHVMIRLIYSVKLADHTPTNSLLTSLGTIEISDCLCLCRLRAYVQLTNSCINKGID